MAKAGNEVMHPSLRESTAFAGENVVIALSDARSLATPRTSRQHFVLVGHDVER
jgi:hypothetical protein